MANVVRRGPVLERCGRIDPENIEEYVGAGGYEALRKVLAERKPHEVIAAVERAGLRGRGGAGFPAAEKWRLVWEADGPKSVVCNAYDSDADAPIGRTLLEQDPHRVLEGLLIASCVVGASRAYIFCRGEASTAQKRARLAIQQAEEKGALGGFAWANGLGVEFEVTVALGWGGFVGGEETAVLAAIEGERAMPSQRPPYPAQMGVLVHSAETLANIPWIMMAEKSGQATKVVALTGAVARPGLAEVPLGTSLRQVVFDVGGGPKDGHGIKAVQVGGPSGGCLPPSLLDTPLDYEPLEAAGAMVGSANIAILDEATCMVDFARQRMAYLRDEACGKCVPCRLGTHRLAGLLEGVSSGLGRPEDRALLAELADYVALASLCGFGIAAANVVNTTLRYFAEDYRLHIEDGRCPTGHCEALRARRYERKAVL